MLNSIEEENDVCEHCDGEGYHEFNVGEDNESVSPCACQADDGNYSDEDR